MSLFRCLQAVSIDGDAANPEAALAGRADVTHVFYVAEAVGTRTQFAAAQDAFRRLVLAAQDAGAQLQQAHFNAVQPGDMVIPARPLLLSSQVPPLPGQVPSAWFSPVRSSQSLPFCRVLCGCKSASPDEYCRMALDGDCGHFKMCSCI